MEQGIEGVMERGRKQATSRASKEERKEVGGKE